MALFERIRSIVRHRVRARSRMQTYQLIRSLPIEIQKDIGWPDGVHARALRQGCDGE